MSEIQCVCPFCNTVFSIEEEFENQNCACPNCGNIFLVQRMNAMPVQQPVYQQPVYQQPVYQQPMYQQQMQPVYQQPMPPQQPMYQQTPMPPPGMGQPYVSPQAVGGYEQKDRIVYILLGLFLGGLGIHNFYAGYTGKGVAQLLITLFSVFVLEYTILGVGIWALVEVCTVREDARGVPFK